MESVRNARRKLRKHFQEIEEPFYGWTHMEKDEVEDVVWKHIHPRRFRYPLEERTIPLERNSHWDYGSSWNFDWSIR